MLKFADRVQDSIVRNNSFLVAGCDPVLDNLPEFILAEAERKSAGDAATVEYALNMFCDVFLAAVVGRVAAVKPNVAFFEQYGVAGLSAFARLCAALRERGVLNIIDAKRGDIGSTAAAYSAAFLGAARLRGRSIEGFNGDALTVNPYLGFDTLEPFLKDCREFGKGIFVLVQTSNPGATAIQGLRADGVAVRERVAKWLAEVGGEFQGECGWSGLGAVVGASYPEEARSLRALMPRSIFLIPGLGAQGAKATDSVAGFGNINGVKGGALINVSRGLLEGQASSSAELCEVISANAKRFNQEIAQALSN
jgi:orotidine-5'-phosphate decarboxylase